MSKQHPLLRILLVALLAALGWALGRPLRAGQAADGARAAIQAVLTVQQVAWNKGDIPKFMEGYWNSPELTFAGSKGFTRGWEPVLARYQKSYADQAAMGKLDFSELEIRPLGPDAALVLGRWHLQRQAGDIGGIFTLVFQKFPQGWLIIHDHTTQILTENPAAK
jgi:ketosteroid isomerase-like protein